MWLFESEDKVYLLKVKVTPKAKSERIKKTTNADGSALYKVYVTQPAESGKANKAVIALLAKEFGVAKLNVTVLHGKSSREKIIQIKA